MRKFEKLTMVLFAIVLASPLFGGGKGDGSAGSKAAAAARDLGGINVVIGNWWSNYDVTTQKPDSADAERTLAWRTQIQKDNNFTISEKNIAGWGEMLELCVTSTLAGSPAASLFQLHPEWAMTMYNQNLLAPLSDAKSVDLTKSSPVKWNQAYRDAFTFNGKVYGIAIGHGDSAHGHGMYFNKRLFREAGIDPELPYNLQKAGTWTWDAYIDLCKKLTRDTNNDGIMDSYAIASFFKDTYDAIAVSNGARYVDKDASGKFVNATNRPEFVEALQFTIRLAREGYVMPQPANSEWNWFVAAFHDGKAAMRIGPEYIRGELQDMKDDWGFVLFPKGPRAKDYLVNVDELIYVIPNTFSAEQVDKILYGLQLWQSPAPGNDAPDAWKQGMYHLYRDVRAVDESMTMLRDPKYGFLAYYMFIPGLDSAAVSNGVWNEGADAAQMIERVSQPWNAAISKMNGGN